MVKRTLVAHGDPACRTVLRDQLAPLGMRVVAEVTDGLSVLASAIELRPDIVFLATAMPHLDGWATARHLRQRFPGCTICLLPETVSDGDPVRMRDGGVDGYLVCSPERPPDATAVCWLTAMHGLSA